MMKEFFSAKTEEENNHELADDDFAIDQKKENIDNLDMEDVLSSIKAQLGEDSEIAEELFSGYEEARSTAEEIAEELILMSKFAAEADIQIDQQKIKQKIMQTSSSLLQTANQQLQNRGDGDIHGIINSVLGKLQRSKRVQLKTLNDLQKIYEKMKKFFDELIVDIEEIFRDSKFKPGPGGFSVRRQKFTIDSLSKFINKNDNDVFDDAYKIKNILEKKGKMEVGNNYDIKKGTEEAEIMKKLKAKFNYKKRLEEIKEFQIQFNKLLQNIVYGENIDFELEGTSSRVMQKYQEIIAQAIKTKSEMKEVFKDERELTDKESDLIMANLLDRADQLLSGYADSITGAKKMTDEEIIKKLKSLEANLVLKLDVIKSLKGKIKPEDLDGVEFSVETASEVTNNDPRVADELLEKFFSEGESGKMPASELKGAFKKYQDKKIGDKLSEQKFDELWQMLSVYEDNWSKYPEKLRTALITGFMDKIKNAEDKTRVYKYLENKKVLAFMRVDDLEDGKKYFGSFNATEVALGGGVASSLVDKVIELEGKDADITAVCDPQGEVVPWYLDKLGFVINGIDLDYEKTGQVFAKIERKKDGMEKYYGDYSNSDIIKEYKNNFLDNKHKKEKQIILKFVVNEDRKEDERESMNEEIFKLTEESNYQVTKCVFETIDKKSRNCYLCFESN